jgi:hypothetical protein
MGGFVSTYIELPGVCNSWGIPSSSFCPSYVTSDFTQLGCGLILTVSFLILLIHTIRGNQNKWLMAMTTAVLINSTEMIVMSWLKATPEISNFISTLYVTMFVVSLGSSLGVHFALGMKYEAIVRKVYGEDEHPKSLYQKALEKTLLFFVVIGPLAGGWAEWQHSVKGAKKPT